MFLIWNKGTWPISVMNLHSTYMACLHVSDVKLGVFLCFVSASLSLIYLLISICCPRIFVVSLSRWPLTLSRHKFSLSFSLLSPTVFYSINSTSCYLYPISLNLSSFCLAASLFCPYLSRQSERHNTVHVSQCCAVGSVPSDSGSTDNVHCLLSILRMHWKLLLFLLYIKLHQ
jgi:hypothetical protein